jgi:hypothetical protein
MSAATPGSGTPRRRGLVGAALAGAMVAIRDILERPRDQESVTVEAAGEPGDIDTEGITLAIDDQTSAVAPPLPPLPVRKSASGRRRRRR